MTLTSNQNWRHIMSEYADLILETGYILTAFLAAFDLLVRQVENDLVSEVMVYEMEEKEN